MKFQRLLINLVGVTLASGLSVAAAQTTAAAPASRDQVKMERAEFLKSHRYDAGMQEWVLKPGFEAPVGVMSRAEITAARDKFLSMHRYVAGTQEWVKLPGPREMSSVSRDQVKRERNAFLKTMVFNNETGQWSPK